MSRVGDLCLRADRTGVTLIMEKWGASGEQQRLRLTTTPAGDLKIDKEDGYGMQGSAQQEVRFRALLGVFNLLGGPYLALITDASKVGAAPTGHTIFRVDKVRFVPVNATMAASLPSKMKSDDKTFLSMLTSVCHKKTFYFAPGFDITLSQQRAAELNQQETAREEKQDSKRGPASPAAEITAAGGQKQAHWQRADIRFFWNRHLVNPFTADPDLWDWITVVMNGFVEIEDQCDIQQHEFRLITISRRSVERQGQRFVVRGADETGCVANFAETEQIAVFPDGQVTSFVQIRGSIPFHWQQLATLKYTPKVELTADDETNQATFTKHFTRLIALYGDVICINLIDRKKDQLALGTLYEQYAERLNHPQLRYIWFDFHHECRKMQWHNLSKLVDMVGDSFNKLGYFASDQYGRVLSLQRGVLRTNCIDNLDRTNVVQSLFARKALLAQFRRASENVLNSPFQRFEHVFKNMWADNADMMSIMYSGTGALKTDFTRTGKRTIQGAIQDGVNSATRYYLNNFRDGRTQDSVDLFLGRFEPGLSYVRGQEDKYVSPFKDRTLFSRQSPWLILRLFVMLVVFVFLLVTLSYKKFSGRSFVDQPVFVEYARPAVPHPLLPSKKSKDGKGKAR